MHPDTASAFHILQDRLCTAEVRDYRRAERYEAALDDLVRNPERVGPVGHLVRNAASYGLKRSVRRARLAPRHDARAVITPDGPVEPGKVLVTDDTYAQLEIEVRDVIERAPLTDFERAALQRLAAGAVAADIAADTGLPLPSVQVRISRARAKLRAVA